MNHTLLPTEQEVQQAQRIVETVSSAKDVNAARLDGKILEKPIVMWAERVLALSKARG